MNETLTQLAKLIGKTVDLNNTKWTVRELLITSQQLVLVNSEKTMLQTSAYGDAKRFVPDSITIHIFDAEQNLTPEAKTLLDFASTN